jgi:hypothetical protein
MIRGSELGWIIWETSRADEGTISVTGADIVADAVRDAGYRKLVLDDATVERATLAARSYTEDWCVDFAEVIELGPRFDEHRGAIARAVLAAAVEEEQTSMGGMDEWGTNYWGRILSEPSEEHARSVAESGKCNLYRLDPKVGWKRVTE